MHPFRALLPLVLLLACGNGEKQVIATFVQDGEKLLTPSQTDRLDSLFRVHEQRTGNEVVLATSTDMDGNERAVDFAVAFGNKHGVGKKDRDNGVVIAISKARREVVIATGYGTEQVLHDSICQRIVDKEMLPHFKDDRHFDGLWAGSMAVV